MWRYFPQPYQELLVHKSNQTVTVSKSTLHVKKGFVAGKLCTSDKETLNEHYVHLYQIPRGVTKAKISDTLGRECVAINHCPP